jgi:hypothetical protein
VRWKVGLADKVIGNDEMNKVGVEKKFLAHHPEKPPMEIVEIVTFLGSFSGIFSTSIRFFDVVESF